MAVLLRLRETRWGVSLSSESGINNLAVGLSFSALCVDFFGFASSSSLDSRAILFLRLGIACHLAYEVSQSNDAHWLA